jgi:hypothetical protein
MVVLEPEAAPALGALGSCESRHGAQVQGGSQLSREVTSEVLDGVYLHPVVQDSLQEGVFAELMGELYGYRPSADDLAQFTGVGVATTPGRHVTDDDQVRPRRVRRPFADCHRSERVGSVSLEALGLAACLLDGPPRALGGQFEPVDEGHTCVGRESNRTADHPEAVAPMAEVACFQLLAMEVIDICVGLAVLAGLVAELS